VRRKNKDQENTTTPKAGVSMEKRRGHGISNKRVVQNTLVRLGMQVSNREVVAALAKFGFEVAEGLVQQVRIGIQKQTAKSERQRVRVPERSRRLQRPPKTPPRRHNGR